MRVLRTLLPVFFVTVMGFVLPKAKADEWDKKTDVTFNNPVEIPGRVLPAGKYVFKLLDSESDRNIVQIFNASQTKLYATILAIPDYRLEPTGKTMITFEERAKNAPEAIRAWFYPGDLFGQEFVYPKVRAVELAQQNKQIVPAMPNEMAEHITKATNSKTEPHVQAMRKAPLVAVTPENKEMEVSKAIQTTPPAKTQPTEMAKSETPKELPKTGSPLPLIGLMGLCSLGSAGALRLFRGRA